MKLAHTAHLAIAVNGQVLDDRGRRIEALILPLVVLAIPLPALLYQAILSLVAAGIGITTRITSVVTRLDRALSAWRTDLVLAYWAARLLLAQRRLAYAG